MYSLMWLCSEKEGPCQEDLYEPIDTRGDSLSAMASCGGEKQPELGTEDEEGESTAAGEIGREREVEMMIEDSNISDSEEDEEECPSSREVTLPACQNNAISEIMGGPCSDDSQSDGSLSLSEEYGFDKTIASFATRTTTGCITVKKVHFSQHVDEFYTSGYEKEDRRGPWEELARDRVRFKRRIQKVEDGICFVFAPAFRSRAYQRILRLPVPLSTTAHDLLQCLL